LRGFSSFGSSFFNHPFTIYEKKEESKGHTTEDNNAKDDSSRLRMGNDITQNKSMRLPPQHGQNSGMPSSSRANVVGNGAIGSSNIPSKYCTG